MRPKESHTYFPLQAKWALDYHAAPYKLVSYSPGPGEYLVRWKAGKWTGPVTAPALVTDIEHVLAQSNTVGPLQACMKGKCCIAKACGPVLQSTTEQWGMYFALTSAAVQFCGLTAHLYGEQISIGVIAVTQACCEPVLHGPPASLDSCRDTAQIWCSLRLHDSLPFCQLQKQKVDFTQLHTTVSTKTKKTDTSG